MRVPPTLSQTVRALGKTMMKTLANPWSSPSQTLLKPVPNLQDAVRELDAMEKHSEEHFRSLQREMMARRQNSSDLLRTLTLKTTAHC